METWWNICGKAMESVGKGVGQWCKIGGEVVGKWWIRCVKEWERWWNSGGEVVEKLWKSCGKAAGTLRKS